MPSSNDSLVFCYNKGCGKKFDPDNNSPESCQHHPGAPVFHDAMKSWSCCDKKSVDFTQFLSYPGCTKGVHSNEKPAEPVKVEEPVLLPVTTSQDRKIVGLVERPTDPGPLTEMKRTVSPSLIASLAKINENKTAMNDENGTKEIPIGTSCKNSSCKASYQGEYSNTDKCHYHSGVAVFHEGMKYWSCCQRKTSDFDNFLSQEGCQIGTHLWFKKETNGEQSACRYDFHQVSGFFILTVYSKNSVPDTSSIKLNPINLDLSISFEGGTKSFKKDFQLYGVIKVEESVVNFLQTKVEIKLKKVDLINWPKLEFTS